MTQKEILKEFNDTLSSADGVLSKEEIEQMNDTPENIIAAREAFEKDFEDEDDPENDILIPTEVSTDEDEYQFYDEP